jgi:hypothetical protein
VGRRAAQDNRRISDGPLGSAEAGAFRADAFTRVLRVLRKLLSSGPGRGIRRTQYHDLDVGVSRINRNPDYWRDCNLVGTIPGLLTVLQQKLSLFFRKAIHSCLADLIEDRVDMALD